MISNAIKYTAEGHIEIKAENDNDNIKISIEDSGVGIDANDLLKLFAPYTKIMNKRSMNKEGVGLGLTICKNLTQALGGNILVESQLGKGSKFTIVLSIKKSDELIDCSSIVLERREKDLNSSH